MKEQKYKLKFVNNGKPFTFPKWTTGKHKRALAKVAKHGRNLSNEEQEDLFQYYVLYESLVEIDEDVPFDKIKALHPENLVILFNAAYTQGKEDILFREGKTPKSKKKSKKSTGKKK